MLQSTTSGPVTILVVREIDNPALSQSLPSYQPVRQEPLVAAMLPTHLLPTTYCLDGSALVAAAACGHYDIVRLLLQWPWHAPCANCQHGQALVSAAMGGHCQVVELLLHWPWHAPRADCQDGEALVMAASRGHEAVVLLLLQQPQHAPDADCQFGRALWLAALGGHTVVARLLLGWPHNAPRADCLGNRALILAAGNGHSEMVHLLQNWPKDAASADRFTTRILLFLCLACWSWPRGLHLLGTCLSGVMGIAQASAYASLSLVLIACPMIEVIPWCLSTGLDVTKRGDDWKVLLAAVKGFWQLTARHAFTLPSHQIDRRILAGGVFCFCWVLLLHMPLCLSMYWPKGQ